MFKPLIDECKLRNFSERTIEVYVYYNKKFLVFVKKKPQEVTNGDVREFLLYLNYKGKSSSTVNLVHNAINFYYRTIMKRNFSKVPFQKREQKIRECLTQEEIKSLINVTSNLKHKLIISLLYASGIRVAELIKLKIDDVDFQRNLLFVRGGKGKKDRYTILSDKVIKEIGKYLPSRSQKNDYLFNSRSGYITSRTAQQILKQAAKKAQIKSSVSPHILRHSFAVHLMENGVEDKYLQKMLGHKDIRTTQIYARAKTKHLLNIKSPHDLL